MKELLLTNQTITFVDDEDYEKLNKFNWTDRGSSIYRATTRKIFRRYRTININITNFILNNYKYIYDHRDRNYRNNQKGNLRECSAVTNGCNIEKIQLEHNTSKYKGVHFHIRDKKWIARITYKKIPIYIGSFNNQEEAAKAYDIKALELHKEFACLNFK